MSLANNQLILGLSLRDDATFTNFYPGDNALLLAALTENLAGRGELFIYLWGMHGVGRTHLLQACCHEMHLNSSAVYLDLKDYQDFSPDILEGLENVELVCLDNINAVLNIRKWEEALFHFYNRLRENNRRLIVSGNIAPGQLMCQLPDLRSRLTSVLSFQVKPLKDAQKLQALLMRAKNRGVVLPESAAQYLLHHNSRNLAELFAILARLEKATLIEQRRITIPFIKSVI